MPVSLQGREVIAGRYQLDYVLGKGGMGHVWAATHLVTRRSVAIKILHGPLQTRPEMRRRFLREARAAGAVEHPNVVQIHDVFELEDQTPVMVMPLLQGETLRQRLDRRRALGFPEAIDTLLPVVSAVGAAHARGVVHRDLKPENVFLAREGASEVIKVLDFGIAKLDFEDGDEFGTITGPGTMLGTPFYMAPEQAFGERDADHRVDVWSLGVLLYEAITGVRPVDGDNLGQMLKAIMSRGIRPLDALAPDVPRAVSSLVMRMLSHDRAERPEDLREVFRTLALFTNVEPPSFGPPTDRLGRESDPAVSMQRGASLRPSSNDALTLASPELPVDPSAPTEEQPALAMTESAQRSVVRPRNQAKIALGVAATAVLALLFWWRFSQAEVEADAVQLAPIAPAEQGPAVILEPRAPAGPATVASQTASGSAPLPAQAAVAPALESAPGATPAREAQAAGAPASRAVRAQQRVARRAAVPAPSAAPTGSSARAPASAPAASAAPAREPPAQGLHEEPPF